MQEARKDHALLYDEVALRRSCRLKRPGTIVSIANSGGNTNSRDPSRSDLPEYGHQAAGKVYAPFCPSSTAEQL